MRARFLALCLLAAPAFAQEVDTIAIGSKAFTESRLLAEILAQLVEERTELRVERRFGLGGTIIAFEALRTGEIDLYPEYTGTGWTVQLGRTETVSDPLRVYAHVAAEFQRRFDITWMQPLGFSNSYALAMEESVAAELGVVSISDLIPHQQRLRAGVSHEFLNRGDGFPGLAETYGLEIADVRGMEHGLSYQALTSKRVDLIDTYTTDGKLAELDLRLLEDDRGFFPPYDCAAIVRNDTLDAHAELGPLLDELAFRIDDTRMQRLNFEVEEKNGSFVEVARSFLEEERLFDAATAPAAVSFGERADMARWVVQHITLTLIAVLLAVIVAIPSGILLTRKRALAGPVLGVAGVIQTIPSLALLAFMIPLPGLGLGARSAIAALFLYALLPIVRNTYTGIREVDPDLLEAATGMGLTDSQRLWKIELPLATRTIMAGIRTSTVISIGVATLAAFIGAGGLGEPILTGLQLNDISLVLSGAIPAALLAIVADFGLGLVERALAR
ncbi:MAG: ABC transporter permease subunit [Acidobacteria bacterium]|nr:ABC transporter permease subunit [Acidobacteriota bacterium]NIQ30624.1 ABC transporter permease subunit [Acidobacteriota bacterium]NIQ85582.1 ABC transporter permease subunit [Acidobacteriota bacterium]